MAFTKAKSRQAKLKVGLYGPQGSGKTLTSLLIAEGLARAEGKKIAYIDTEHGTDFYAQAIPERKVHPEAFDFDRIVTRAIYEAVNEVENMPSEYGVLIIDSVTHIWEAAMDSYTGKKTSQGGIPMWAWSKIKRPYKKLMRLFLDGNFHGIICGREGNVFEEDEDDKDKIKVVGKKMKAEGETPYEPHILGRMIPERLADGQQIIQVFFEKDRSGILQGRTIQWPGFSTVEPLVQYLSGDKQGAIGDSAEKDEQLADDAEDRERRERVALFTQIKSAIQTAADMDGLKTAWSLTRGKKGRLGDALEELSMIKDARKSELLGVSEADI